MAEEKCKFKVGHVYRYKAREQDGNTFTVIGIDKIPTEDEKYKGWVVHCRCWEVKIRKPPMCENMGDEEFRKDPYYRTITLSIHTMYMDDCEYIEKHVGPEDELDFPSYEQWKEAFSWFNGGIAEAINMLDKTYENMHKEGQKKVNRI